MVIAPMGRRRPAGSRLTGSLLAPMDGEKGQPQEENADGTEVEDRGRDGSMDAIAHACRLPGDAPILLPEAKTLVGALPADRKSVVEGKSVSVRLDSGGRRFIKTKTSQHEKRISNRTQ